MLRRYGLREDQWERIKDRLPGRTGSIGVTAEDNRRFVEAVLYRYRAGVPWRDLPERFGDWKNVHRRHSRWSESGGWENLFKLLASDSDNEYVMIDSTVVRAHQHAAGAKKSGAGHQSGPRARSHWTIKGRIEHENPCSCRRSGQSSQIPADAGAGVRS